MNGQINMRWNLLINIIATYFVGPFFSKVVNCSIKPKDSAFQFEILVSIRCKRSWVIQCGASRHRCRICLLISCFIGSEHIQAYLQVPMLYAFFEQCSLRILVKQHGYQLWLRQVEVQITFVTIAPLQLYIAQLPTQQKSCQRQDSRVRLNQKNLGKNSASTKI